MRPPAGNQRGLYFSGPSNTPPAYFYLRMAGIKTERIGCVKIINPDTPTNPAYRRRETPVGKPGFQRNANLICSVIFCEKPAAPASGSLRPRLLSPNRGGFLPFCAAPSAKSSGFQNFQMSPAGSPAHPPHSFAGSYTVARNPFPYLFPLGIPTVRSYAGTNVQNTLSFFIFSHAFGFIPALKPISQKRPP